MRAVAELGWRLCENSQRAARGLLQASRLRSSCYRLERRGDAGDGDEWLPEQLEAERRHCFELDREWPIRVAVLRTGDTGDHVLSLVVHHIASDHWSAGVLFADVITAYRARRDGEDPSWAPLRVQYADYAAWQRTFLGEPGGQETHLRPSEEKYIPEGQAASRSSKAFERVRM